MNSNTLIGGTLRNPPMNRVAWFLFLCVVGSLVIAASAKVRVPMGPVDMSLQSLAIFVMAAAYGRNLGLATICLYMAQGAMGFPVFQGTPERGIGLAYMVGSTGGYLLGYVVMTGIVGWAADRGWSRNPFKIGAAMLAGEVVLLLLGALWLAHLFGVEKAFAYGVGPFIVSDLLKIGIAAGVIAGTQRLVARLRDVG